MLQRWSEPRVGGVQDMITRFVVLALALVALVGIAPANDAPFPILPGYCILLAAFGWQVVVFCRQFARGAVPGES